MNDMWLYLHENRARDLEEEVRRAMHRRVAAELRRRERAAAKSVAWARVVNVLSRRGRAPVPCPTC